MNWIKLTTPVTVLCFLLQSLVFSMPVAYADTPSPPSEDRERITTLRLGEPAPFAGTLFSTKAAAKLMVDLKFTQETCNLEIDRRLGLLRADMQLKLDILQGSYDSLHTEFLEGHHVGLGQHLEQELVTRPPSRVARTTLLHT